DGRWPGVPGAAVVLMRARVAWPPKLSPRPDRPRFERGVVRTTAETGCSTQSSPTATGEGGAPARRRRRGHAAACPGVPADTPRPLLQLPRRALADRGRWLLER